jgi:hypothetical protein
MIMSGGIKVFIAGSRRLSKLSRDVTRRLDNIIEKGLTVLVGDANGVDKAVQTYFSKKRYANLQVFCMQGSCRNNVGNWPARVVSAANPSRRDFAYYSTKERVMSNEADYGLMLWDGESRGTLTSIVDLVGRGKPVAVYFAPDKTFHTLRSASDLDALVDRVDPATLAQVNPQLHSISKSGAVSHRSDTALLF